MSKQWLADAGEKHRKYLEDPENLTECDNQIFNDIGGAKVYKPIAYSEDAYDLGIRLGTDGIKGTLPSVEDSSRMIVAGAMNEDGSRYFARNERRALKENVNVARLQSLAIELAAVAGEQYAAESEAEKNSEATPDST